MRASSSAGAGAEGMRAGRQLPGHHAEREDVGARVDVLPAQLLGRHVAWRAERDPVWVRRGSLAAARARPKSRIFTRPSAHRMMFSGLKSRWTMPAACAAASAAARSIKRGEQAIAGSGPRRELFAQRLAAHQLRDQIELAVELLERVDRGDRRVGERGRGARLARQALAADRIGRVLGGSAFRATVRRSRVSSAA